MVKKIIFTLLTLTLVLFAGCENNQKNEVTDFDSCVAAGNPIMESYPAKCSYNGETYIQVLSLKEQCEFNSGKWIDEVQECEGISNEVCSNIGGNFENCASACRNNLDAQICTMQCVQVCEFSDEPKVCTKEYAPVCGVNNVTYSNRCLAGNVEVQHFGKCFTQEDKQECEDQGGKYEQLGMAQIWQCNMPAVDAGQSCEDVSECQGTCLSQNGTGVCSDWTRNFGCIATMHNGDPVEICVD